MTLFYLEGPDASGKTTLLNELMKNKGSMFFHNGVYPSTQEAIMQYYNQLYFYEHLMSETFGQFDVYLDRGFMAENIYGPVMRNTKIEGPEYMQLLNKMISLNTILILCVPPFDTCYDVWSQRQETEYVKDKHKFADIWNKYKELKPPLGMRVYHYDYTTDNGKIHEFIGGL